LATDTLEIRIGKMETRLDRLEADMRDLHADLQDIRKDIRQLLYALFGAWITIFAAILLKMH
jgi:chaperonin cofactor prefoldin